MKTAGRTMSKTAKSAIQFRQSLFWDVHPKNIDPQKHAQYIIERVLDLGTISELRWLFATYPRTLIRETLKRPRSQVHAKSKALWSLVLK
jgi:hypothetical protein